MSFPTLIKHVKNGNLFSHDGHEYRTPRKLLDMGIRYCADCGTMLIDTMYCSECDEVALVIADDIPTKPDFIRAPKAVAPQPPKNPVKQRNRCPECGNPKYRYNKTCSRHCGGVHRHRVKNNTPHYELF